MKRLWTITLLSIFSFSSLAQLVNMEWAYSMGSSHWGSGYYDGAASIAVDNQDNILITGWYFTVTDFDPGTNVLNFTAKGKQDIFVQKVDNNGQLIWAHTFGNSLHDQGTSITTDGNGNVYVIGFYSGTVDFDPGSAVYNLTSKGHMDVFVLKLRSDGDFVWARSMGGSTYDRAAHIEVDANGNVYALGTFENTVDFDPGSGIMNISSNGGTDYFIQKLDSNGTLVWVKTFGSSTADYVSSIVIDDIGNLYVTGGFSGTVDFDPSSVTQNKISNGDIDVFVQKLSASGNLLWIETFGGPGADISLSMTKDGNSNIYVTGGYEDSVDFDPGINSHILYSKGYDDAFIEKLDDKGNFVWVKSMGGNEHDRGIGISIDGGNIYSVGWCQGTADYDPGPDTFNLVAQGNQFDTYIQKLDANGDFVWAKVQGDILYDIAQDIKINSSGEMIIGGYFMDTVDFDPGFSNYELISNGSADIFVQKLSECFPLTRTDHIEACVEHTWIDGITYTTNNNKATFGIINEFTCDSVITLDLTLIPVEIGVSVNSNIMIADAVGATYQWLDCSNGFQPLVGEITRSYIATQNGNYAVEVTENGCADTSACISITSVGIDEAADLDQVSIYPNPSNRVVNVDLGNLSNVSLKVYGLDNRILYQQENINNKLFQFELDAAPGMYLIEISAQGKVGYQKLLMED